MRTPNTKSRKDFRHEISYEAIKQDGHVYFQATCCCNKFASARFWAKARAEEAAYQHLGGINYGNGRRDV